MGKEGGGHRGHAGLLADRDSGRDLELQEDARLIALINFKIKFNPRT